MSDFPRLLQDILQAERPNNRPAVILQMTNKFSSSELGAWLTGTGRPNNLEMSLIRSIVKRSGATPEELERLDESYYDNIESRIVERPHSKVPSGQLERLLKIIATEDRVSFETNETGDVTFTGRPSRVRSAVKTLSRLMATLEPLPGSPTQPAVPESGPAAVLKPTPDGFEIDAKQSPPNELDDPTQKAIYSRLSQRVARLRTTMLRIENSNAELVAEFMDYAALIGENAADVDVATLWSAGSALTAFVKAHDPALQTGTMTPPLEPGTIAQLTALMADHVVFVGGTSVGKELQERVFRDAQAGLQANELGGRTKPVLDALADVRGLLATRAKHLVDSLRRALGVLNDVTLPLAVGSTETARNAVLSIGTTIYRACLHVEGITIAGNLMGIDTSTLEPARMLFRDNAPAIMALIQNEPQMVTFVEWVVMEVERNERSNG